MGVDMSQKHTTTMSKNSSNDQRADEIVATMTDLISKLSTVCAMMDFFGWQLPLQHATASKQALQRLLDTEASKLSGAED